MEKNMKNLMKIVAVVIFAIANTAMASEPVGAAMVSTKVVQHTAVNSAKSSTTQVASTQIKSFQWGSTPARKQVVVERIVKAKNLAVKPSVITWPSTMGGTKNRPIKGRGRK